MVGRAAAAVVGGGGDETPFSIDVEEVFEEVGGEARSGSCTTEPWGHPPVIKSEEVIMPEEEFGDFVWHDVSCSYERTLAGGKRYEVEALHAVSGFVERGEMLAVLGPSGAGKSCLLDILADRKTVGKLRATRTVDGRKVHSSYFKRHTAYVTQEDIFHPTQTVEEAVMFQAHLRLDRHVSKQKKHELVRKLIEEVGLQGKEMQRVGGPLPGGLSIRGLSGGEKRRLSLCCGTITNPRLLFLDEPTSGLDSFAALVVMRLMHKYCQRGMMIICTIHQPRPAIWALFKKVMVLSQGHLMYFGEASKAEAWFSQTLGFPRAPNTSVVDYVLDLVSVNFIKDEEVFGSVTMKTVNDVQKASASFVTSPAFIASMPHKPSFNSLRPSGSLLSLASLTGGMWKDGDSYKKDERTDSLSSSSSDSTSSTGVGTIASIGSMWENVAQWSWQFRVILLRNFRNYYRNPGNILARSSLMILVALMQGLVYFDVGNSEKSNKSVLSVAHVMGSLYYTLFGVTILPFASLSLFMFDRQFYSGEAASRLYPCSAYYLANMLLETLLNTANAMGYSFIAYYLMNYVAFTRPTDVTGNFFVYMGCVVAQTNAASMVLLLSALVSPNQDIAFALAAAYSALAVLVSGFLVPFPQFFRYATWMQWAAHLKYTFQAASINSFTGTSSEFILDAMQLNHPASVQENFITVWGMWLLTFTLGYVCLRLLYKEQR